MSDCVAEGGLKLTVLQPQPRSAEIIGAHHHAWLQKFKSALRVYHVTSFFSFIFFLNNLSFYLTFQSKLSPWNIVNNVGLGEGNIFIFVFTVRKQRSLRNDNGFLASFLTCSCPLLTTTVILYLCMFLWPMVPSSSAVLMSEALVLLLPLLSSYNFLTLAIRSSSSPWIISLKLDCLVFVSLVTLWHFCRFFHRWFS